MVLKGCSKEGCTGKFYGLEMCERHYKQCRRSHGLEKGPSKEYLKIYARTPDGKYTALKRAAKDKNLGFDITREQHAILIQQSCVYCGGKLAEAGHGLDRTDTHKGYLIDNVVPCCTSCNRMKNECFTHDEMMIAMKAVLEYRKGRV